MTETAPWPLEIRLLADRRELVITFDNNVTRNLPAKHLRIESPSAEVQGHAPGQKKIITGKENVKITAIEPVGNYAIRLVFDDGHDTGLYTWNFLYNLDQESSAGSTISAKDALPDSL